MSQSIQENDATLPNPIELIEQIAQTNAWRVERRGAEELVVEIPAHWCTYLVYFTWRDDAAALHFACCYDLYVPPRQRAALYELIVKCNERLWIGHFSLWEEENMPLLRHTLLFSGNHPPGVDLFEELIDIGLSECERFYPAFTFVMEGGHAPNDAIEHALLEPMGEA